MFRARKVYIETVGCQMNVLDGQLVADQLRAAGHRVVGSAREADTILLNTCSVRQHAEDKIYSALGRLKHVKEGAPGKVIGVLGCMAQKDRERVFRRAPHVDLVVGPGQLADLPAVLERVVQGEGPQLAVSLDRRGGRRRLVEASFRRFELAREPGATGRHQAMVRAVYGCDKFCSYCIVPSVRGPEQSRPPEEIQAEVRQLADRGCLEVTLLGQTINSYRFTSGERTTWLADLLERIHDTSGIRRIKFVTNYPPHMTGRLLEAVRDLPKVSPYLHVPAQSGSDRVLKRMNRGYTAAEYREMMAMIRQTVPDAAVTSDFIVGFCGETEEDYQRTVELVRECRFKNSFIFKYSRRSGTKAAERYADDVPEPVKRRRNNDLLAIQNRISFEGNLAFRGRVVEVLVEGLSKAAKKRGEAGPAVQLTGRTPCDRIVVLDGPQEWIGTIFPVEIYHSSPFTLFGRRYGAT